MEIDREQLRGLRVEHIAALVQCVLRVPPLGFADPNLRGLINPPGFVVDGSQYLTIAGSHAYGTNRPDSDFDIMGFCMPTKEVVFPHLAGEIHGFGRQKKQLHRMEYRRERACLGR